MRKCVGLLCLLSFFARPAAAQKTTIFAVHQGNDPVGNQTFLAFKEAVSKSSLYALADSGHNDVFMIWTTLDLQDDPNLQGVSSAVSITVSIGTEINNSLILVGRDHAEDVAKRAFADLDNHLTEIKKKK